MGIAPPTEASKPTAMWFFCGGGKHLVPVLGEQSLVGGDHMLFILDGLEEDRRVTGETPHSIVDERSQLASVKHVATDVIEPD